MLSQPLCLNHVVQSILIAEPGIDLGGLPKVTHVGPLPGEDDDGDGVGGDAEHGHGEDDRTVDPVRKSETGNPLKRWT